MQEKTASPAKNRRVYPRFELEVEVSASSDHNFFMGLTENLSEGGVFISTYDHLELGTRISFTFTLPDGGAPIDCAGEVCWVRECSSYQDSISPGIGVRFLELASGDVARIRRFLQQREAIFYEA